MTKTYSINGTEVSLKVYRTFVTITWEGGQVKKSIPNDAVSRLDRIQNKKVQQQEFIRHLRSCAKQAQDAAKDIITKNGRI